MKHFITFLSISFISTLLLATQPAEAAVMRITQPKIELALSGGQQHTGELDVENPTEEPAAVRVYLEDWKYKGTGAGEKEFGPAGTMEFSASKWITFSPAEVTLEPFSKRTIRYTIAVPEGASGGNYSVLFFESIVGQAADPYQEGASVNVMGRIGALFFIHVKETVRREGAVAEVKVTPSSGNAPLEIESTFRNTGNVDITLGGNFLIMDAEGKVVGRGDLDKIYTFPGMTSTRKAQWVGRLPQGSYDLLLTYDMGQGQAIVREEKLVIA